MTRATEQQIRDHFEALGAEVHIDAGHIEYRYDGGEWLEGRYVTEYVTDHRGNVHLT